MLKKIALIGGGNIGGVLAQELFQRKLAGTVGAGGRQGAGRGQGQVPRHRRGHAHHLQRREVRGRQGLRRHQGRRPRGEHRRRAAHGSAGRHLPEPRGTAGDQPADHRRRSGGHQAVLPGCHRHLDREPPGRHRVPALPEAEPAEAQADGHGRRPRLGPLPLLRGPGRRRVGGERRGDGARRPRRRHGADPQLLPRRRHARRQVRRRARRWPPSRPGRARPAARSSG